MGSYLPLCSIVKATPVMALLTTRVLRLLWLGFSDRWLWLSTGDEDKGRVLSTEWTRSNSRVREKLLKLDNGVDSTEIWIAFQFGTFFFKSCYDEIVH